MDTRRERAAGAEAVKEIVFEGKTHRFPDDFTDADISTALSGASSPAPQGNVVTNAYKAIAEPATRAASRIADVLTEPLVASERAALGEPREQILRSYTTGPGIEDMNARSAGTTNPAAKAVVPQTPLEAGAMAGTMLAGPAAPLVKAVPYLGRAMTVGRGALGRILGGAVGGEIGGEVSGEPTGKGALVGGGAATVGEVGGAAAGKLYRSTDMGRRQIAADDARNVGNAIDAAAPTLKPGTTANAMQRTAEGQGLARINAAKEAAVADIEKQLAAARPGDLDLPAGLIPVPALGKQTTLREANAELSAIGDMMRGIKALDPRYKDVDLKAKYAEVANGITDGIEAVLGPEAAARWAQAVQAPYRAGRFLGDNVLGRTSLFRQGEFNITDLQRWLKNPDNRAALAKATGGDLGKGTNLAAYNQFVDAVERGAAPGMVDRMTGEAPGLLSGRGSYGLAALPMRLLHALLPNASSKYVGNVSQQMPPALQAILDAALQKGAGAVAAGDRR